MDWPGSLKRGITWVSTPSIRFRGTVAGASPKKNMAFLEDARKHGMTVCYQESPFHVMMKPASAGDGNLFATSQRAFPEFLPVLSRAMIPARDSEDWRRLGKEHGGNTCTWTLNARSDGANGGGENARRCKEGQLKSGKPMAEYLVDRGTELVR